MPNHAAGILAWQHNNTCTIRDSEDARQSADHAALRHTRWIIRPATGAETYLLGVLGYTVPENTTVVRCTNSIHRRVWPTLPEPA
jgi:hypothetical protein